MQNVGPVHEMLAAGGDGAGPAEVRRNGGDQLVPS